MIGGPDVTYNSAIGGDGFVSKVRADGTGLSYSGYIGGFAHENPEAIAVDSAGAAYVAGRTDSAQDTFPETVGPDLTFGGSTTFEPSDGFVAKVRP